MKMKLLLLTILAAISCVKEPVINKVYNGKEDETQREESTLPEANADGLKICSFNIRYYNTSDVYPWSQRKDPVMKFIRTEAPDFIGLQEVRATQSQDFSFSLANDYGYYDVERDSGNGVSVSPGEGCGILYRKDRFTILDKGFFWLADPSDKLPAKNEDGTYSSWNSSHRRIVVWVKAADKLRSDRVVWFLSTHFDHKSSLARHNSSELVLKKIKEMTKTANLSTSKDPLFLVADFNCQSTSSDLAPLMSELKYARSAAPVTDDGRTYNGFGETSKSIIDHIFYMGNLKAQVYDVVTEDYGVKYISDHYPIVFTCEYGD